ncbi:MAG: D-glycero-beta-D-manno-heptose 1-phosphate adenylyltransferase [Bacteroidia bacterium]|nr:D-glycero-beta-D-manno-heptose 1-phosphate adenylyltransferase [Bacteroidia bacterium]MCO5253733.1 D-glycero-beta-D-manno-heptose 1-phosphate adenylyltransferase [Bacteroidota bacterium]
MRHPKSKILSLEDALKIITAQKTFGKRVVFTNGCFDILHRGHLEYLMEARQLGDFLLVGVNSDNSVRRLGKSPSRPLQDEQGRALAIASLYFVDLVIIFDEDTPHKLISTILPDILVKGADYNPEDIVGYKEVTDNGGTVKTIPFIEGYSTTSIEQKILKENK